MSPDFKIETGFYTGKKIDSDTGLYYFNARWYDPELGRFITEDPIKDGLNWFVYVANNPLRYIDPTGLKAIVSDQSEEEHRRSEAKTERENRQQSYWESWQSAEVARLEAERAAQKEAFIKIAEEAGIDPNRIRFDLAITVYRKAESFSSVDNPENAGLDSAVLKNVETGSSEKLNGLQTVSNSSKKDLSPNGISDTLDAGLSLGRYEYTDSEEFVSGKRLAIVGGKTMAGEITNIYGSTAPGVAGTYAHSLGKQTGPSGSV